VAMVLGAFLPERLSARGSASSDDKNLQSTWSELSGWTPEG
jgi:hypothetical protein